MIAGESVDDGEEAASGDSTALGAEGDCDDISVLELECCFGGSGTVSDILRAAVCSGLYGFVVKHCCQRMRQVKLYSLYCYHSRNPVFSSISSRFHGSL